MTPLAEYYESGTAPHEALGRAARKLSSGGALYLGAGVGIERQEQGAQKPAKFSIARTGGGKAETFDGPLSAVMRGFALAGAMSSPDSPGGAKKITDPAVAARLRELNDSERSTQQDIERYQARVAAKVPAQTPGLALPSDDSSWEARRLAELRRELQQIRAERAALLASGKVEEADDFYGAIALIALEEGDELAESAKTAALASKHSPIGKGGSNWITRSKPGNTGELPAYIQNVRNAIMREGTPEGQAHAIAIGRVRAWAEGKGNVGAEVRAAAAKAIAEFDAMRAKSKVKAAAK